MNLIQRVTGAFFKLLTASMFRVDGTQLTDVPSHGPLIIVANHVHIPEIPTLFARLLPRKVYGMVQAERVLDRNIVGGILRLFGTIPVWRGEADLNALRSALRILAQGNIVLLDPEGTRSHDGCLQIGRAGAILIALHSQAPILPVVHYGSEHYQENLKRLRRTDLRYVVGKPFRLKPDINRVTHAIRREMIDEVMSQMAGLLPAQYRGEYAGGVNGPFKYLVFDSP